MSTKRPLPSLHSRRAQQRRIEVMCRMMATYNRQLAEELERFLFDDMDVTGLTAADRSETPWADPTHDVAADLIEYMDTGAPRVSYPVTIDREMTCTFCRDDIPHYHVLENGKIVGYPDPRLDYLSPPKFPTPERMSEFNPHKHPM